MVGKSSDLPQIVSSGTSLHAIWKSDSASMRYIMYTRSLDNGASWQEPRVIFTFPSHTGGSAGDGGTYLRKMAVNANGVHVFLSDYNTRGTWYGRLVYIRSINNGTSFEAPRYLFDANDAFRVNNILPVATPSGVSVVFLHKCNWASIDTCYVMNSNDNGANFSRDTVYTSACGGGVPNDYWTDGTRHIVCFSWAYFYYGFQEGQQFVSISNDGGKHFKITSLSALYSSKYRSFLMPADHQPPLIAVSGQNMYVLGYDYPAGYGRLYVNRSTDNGQSFTQSLICIDSSRLAQEQSTIAASGSYVYVSTLMRNDKVILFSSSNNAQSFGKEVYVTTGSDPNTSMIAGSAYPRLFIDPTVANGSMVQIAHHAGRYAYSTDGGNTVKGGLMLFPFSLRSWGWFDVCMDAQGLLHYLQSAGSLTSSSGNTDVDIWYRRYNYKSVFSQQGIGNRCLLMSNEQPTPTGDHQKDLLQIPSTDAKQFAGSYSIEFRFKYSSRGDYSFPILIKPAGGSHTSGTYHFSLRVGYIVASVIPRGQPQIELGSLQVLSPDQWYHVALTVDTSRKSSNVNLYINGELNSTASATVPITTSYDPHTIGYPYDNAYTIKAFCIDELRMWKRALSQTEITLGMSSSVATNAVGLIGYFPFDGTSADLTATQGAGMPMYKESFVPCSDSMLFISRLSPNVAGNTGDITLSLSGGGFREGMHVQLRKDSATVIVASSVQIFNKRQAEAIFDLRGAALAQWKLEVFSNKDSAVLNKALEVRQGEVPNPWVSIHGRNLFLANRWQNFTIYVGNTANVDATGVPVWLALSDSPDLEMEFSDFSVGWSEYAVQKGYDKTLASLPLFVKVNAMQGLPFNARVYPLYLSRVPANSVVALHFRVRSSSIQRIQMKSWVNPPFFQSPLNVELAQCMVSSVAERIVDNTITAIPAVGCVYAVGKLVYNPFDSYKAPGGPRTVLSTMREVGGTMLDCGVNLSGVGALVTGFVKFVSDLDQYVNDISSCKKRFARNGRYDGAYDIVGSIDPNMIVGPSGYAPERYTSGAQRYVYSVYCENKSSATAPAHQVVILDTLNKNQFDLTSFHFGSISIGDTSIQVVAADAALSTLVDLRPKRNVIVKIDASMNPTNGAIQWVFSSLDPTTLQPTEEAMGGFLPPNKTSPEGEAMVSYIVSLKPYLQHKSQLKNAATIVFDQNAAIVTNTYINTIDNLPPQSSLKTLVISNDTTLTLSWDATDDASGVVETQVWMSVADSAYQPIVGSGSSSAKFGFYRRGTGKSYRFYTIASDSVGNQEAAPYYADLTGVEQEIEQALQPEIVSFVPNPVHNFFDAVVTLPTAGNVTVTIVDILGRSVFNTESSNAAGLLNLHLNTSAWSQGVYTLSVTDTKQRTARTSFVVVGE